MRIYQRKKSSGERVWWASWTERGVTVRRSTRCTTKAAAELIVARWERERADPAYAAANSATLASEAGIFLTECAGAVRAGKLAAATLGMYEQKVGHVLRILGDETRLADVDVDAVARFIAQRRAEGAHDSTIYKEWIGLRGILKGARHRNRYHRDPSTLKPLRFGPSYVPRKTFLTLEQTATLMRELDEPRRAVVAFVIATSARRGEWSRALREDVRLDTMTVRLRGTKTAESEREIPVPAVFQRLLTDAIGATCVKAGPLFAPWQNARRDIIRACERAGVPAVTWNDLRRTFASLLVQGGASVDVVARLMGHATTQMVQKVYGKQTTESLRALLAASFHEPTANQTGGADVEAAEQVDGVPSQNAAETGGPSGTRTRDLRIKRPSFAETNHRPISDEYLSPASGEPSVDHASAADTGIFNPAANGIVDRENKHVVAERDAACAANGMSSETANRLITAAAAHDLQPGGGLDEPGTSSAVGGFTRYPWTAEELRALSGETALHPIALAYLRANGGYGARGRAWEGAR